MCKNHTFILITTVYGFVFFIGQSTYAAYIDIAPGEYRTGSLAAGQVHTYCFAASARDSVTILMGQVGAQFGEAFEPRVELHAPDGTIVDANSGADSATIQSVRVPQSGTYLIIAREKDGRDARDYGLSLVKNPGTVTVNDPHGGPIEPGEYKSGRIEPGDIDAYTFAASAGDSVTILMGQIGDQFGEAFEPRVELHAPDGTVLAVNSGSDSATIQSVIVPQSGIYFIIAREQDGRDAWDYGLSLVKNPGTVTVNDPNGGPIEPGEYKSGRIEPGDIDAYTFAASAGDSVTILMGQIGDEFGDGFEPRVELHAPDGTVVDVNSGSDSANIQSVRVPQSGTYFIIAREQGGCDAWDYGLSLVKIPGTVTVNDPDGGPIEPGENKSGRIEPGDIDAYTFTASAGDSVTILMGQIGDQFGEEFEPRVELHAPDGTVLAVNSGSDSANIESVIVPQSGTYFIIAREKGGSDAWDYSLSLSGQITPGIPGELDEVSSTEDALVETIYAEQWALGTGNVVGDLNGVFALNDFELVTIGTGPWAGMGYSRAFCEANLEGASYMGEWQGIAFFDPDATEISVKGSIVGEILATVEGTLTESAPGSGIYDQYQATWKIGRLSNTTTSATVVAAGTLTDQNRIEYPSTGLYLLQTAMDGDLAGDLSGPLSTVINHVRIAERDNPHNGYGFSVISYVYQSGSGQGYTCDELTPSGVLTMRGMFTDPLYGVFSASLNETIAPRVLHLSLQRVDLGLPPMADLEVTTWGPERVSPGQTINLMVEYRNQGLTQAYDSLVVAQLPAEVNYVSSTNNGIYRWETHEVIWRLGTVSPKHLGNLSATTTVKWGLPWGTQLRTVSMIGTTGAETDTYVTGISPISNILEYLDYQPVYMTSIEVVSDSEFEDALTDPNFVELLVYANDLGFTYSDYTSKISYVDGSFVIASLMFPTAIDTMSEVILLSRFTSSHNESTSWFLLKYTNTSISLLNRQGGIIYDFNESSFGFIGDWEEASSCAKGACIWNCLGQNALAVLIGCIPEVGTVGTTVSCSNCVTLPNGPDKWDSCAECLIGSIGSVPHPITSWAACGAGAVFKFLHCLTICQSPFDRTRYLCDPNEPDRTRCIRGLFGDCDDSVIEKCSPNCTWQITSRRYCGITCDGRNVCCPCGSGGCNCDCPPPSLPNTGSDTPTVTPARDPNRKMGPQGNILPGQKLDYRVEYENEGEGIAFGVYFTDTLDEDLDDSTLEIGPVIDVDTGVQIAPPGNYNPATRTITWFVGQVDPNQGGYADLSLSVKPDAINGTDIINFATVYFPSVPEATRTNGIVSIVSLNQPPVVDAGPDETLNEGQLFSRIGSFVDDDMDDSWFVTVDYGDGSGTQTLELAGKIFTLRHTYENDGLFQVTVTVTDSWGEFGVGQFVVTVNKVPPTVSVNTISQNVQYSDSIDEVIFTATSVSADTMHARVSYSTDGGITFATKMTSPPMLVLPDDGTIAGGLGFIGDIAQVGTGTWTLAGVADLPPGSYVVRLRVSDQDGASASVDTTINVLQEDAFAIYVGAESVSTPSVGDNVATVELLAVILDMTAVNPASDSDAGNITKALVTFVNRDNGAVIAEGIPVMLLDPEDLTVGLARYEWVVDLGSQDFASFTVGIIVNGYYTRNSSADNTVVTVSRPVELIWQGRISSSEDDGYAFLDEFQNLAFDFLEVGPSD